METSILEKLYLAGLSIDRAFRIKHKLSQPVLSVGNIALGGRAKTPFVIEICNWLTTQKLQPVVLTRGYARKSKDPVFLTQGENVPAADIEGGTAALAGDEACEIFARTKATVLVGEHRYNNAQIFLKSILSPSKTIFVLDDGFQHWSLHRDFDLALIVSGDRKQRVLPLGSLREPMDSLKRADVVFCLGEDFKKISVIRSAPTSKAIAITTRAPDALYFDHLKSQLNVGLELIALKDHADRDEIVKVLKGRRETELLVGAKEASKLLKFNDFKSFLTSGYFLLKIDWREFNLHYVACELEISSSELLWGKLASALRLVSV